MNDTLVGQRALNRDDGPVVCGLGVKTGVHFKSRCTRIRGFFCRNLGPPFLGIGQAGKNYALNFPPANAL